MLRVLGDNFSPDSILGTARLPVTSRFKKGEQSKDGRRPPATSGFNCEVSPSTATLSEQVNDALRFLERHYDDLAHIATIPAVESFYLDFGHECRLNDSDVMAQRDFLPPELLRVVGSLGLGVCLTLFPALNDGRGPDERTSCDDPL